MSQKLLTQIHLAPQIPKPNIAIKYRKKKPKPITRVPDSETTIEYELQHSTIDPPRQPNYIDYLSSSNTKPQTDGVLNESDSNGRKIDHHVYQLLKRINLGKNFSQYINRKSSKVNSKAMFQNSFLAENVNIKSNKSTHKISPTNRMNTWMGCSQSPFFKRQSQMLNNKCRLTKRARNKSLPDYSLKKILVTTQLYVQPTKQPDHISQNQIKNNSENSERIKKRRNVSYCDIR